MSEEAGSSRYKIESRLALLGVVAVVLGACIGVGGSLASTLTQTHNQANQARCDFIRQERQKAYVRFMTDSVITDQLETDFYNRYYSPDFVRAGGRRGYVADGMAIVGMIKKIVVDEVAIRILGPSDAAHKAYALTSTHRGMIHPLRLDVFHATRYLPSATETRQIGETYHDAHSEIYSAETAFLLEANVDVASCQVNRIKVPLGPT